MENTGKREVVFVTGSSRGIGRATALRFAKAGCLIAINCLHTRDKLAEVQREIEEMGVPCRAYPGDIGNYETAFQIFDQIKKELGEVSILVNNAGISSIGLFQDMSCSSYQKIIETNLLSVMHCSHLAIPSMVMKKKGKIINISSVWGKVGASCEAVYSASKGGVNSFTKALGKELAPSNIQVNAIACGFIDTEMNHCFDEPELRALLEEIPAGRFGKMEEVAQLAYDIAFAPAYLTGQIITLDGGWI